MHRRPALTRVLTTTLAGLVLLAILAPHAAAGPLVAAAAGCTPQQLSKPFRPWLDPASYTPVRDAGFERRADGWKLTGDAHLSRGNEPWHVLDAKDEHVLTLPAGSSATSAPICVGLAEPTLRFFARSSGSPASALQVEVLFEDALGTVHALPIGAEAGGAWRPTAVMPILASLLPLMPGEQTPVAFRFTPRGGADWQIDDVLVDPWCQR